MLFVSKAPRTMIKATVTTLCLLGLLAVPSPSIAQPKPAQEVIDEAVRRQADAVLLRKKVEEAQAVQQTGDQLAAAKLYEEAWALIEKIGPSSTVEAETAAVTAGLVQARLALAKEAQKYQN